ncbi:MAG TPA: TIGR04282 family arsenosugar biosynthesis glycosyltransferase [Stellaceae bacterium]|nr:TIGR04282 family arsenosugar biosynthesis glycosyltransferase [Stellaceae bacterium]
MPLPRHLVIFARRPQLGTGKRRLAKDIGPVQALRFQRVLLAHTLRRLGRDRRWTTWLAVTPDRSGGPWAMRLRLLNQGSGDLGRRMATVMRKLPPGPVAIVGADIPGLMPHHVTSAFGQLGRRDAVFGPASDGGYWLVGLRRRPRILDPFREIRWSTEHALADTLRNLARSEVALLDTLADVDDGPSLSRNPGWEVLCCRQGRGPRSQPLDWS